MALSMICNCEFDADPDDPDEATRETSWHYRRTCDACQKVWWSLHCPHDLHQTPCPNCGFRAFNEDPTVTDIMTLEKAEDINPTMNLKTARIENRIAILSDALKSISKNTCCDNCHEAAMVARSALASYIGLAREPSQCAPIAWRWRAPGAVNWIYDPDPAWMEEHKHDIELEPLYALVTDKLFDTGEKKDAENG